MEKCNLGMSCIHNKDNSCTFNGPCSFKIILGKTKAKNQEEFDKYKKENEKWYRKYMDI